MGFCAFSGWPDTGIRQERSRWCSSAGSCHYRKNGGMSHSCKRAPLEHRVAGFVSLERQDGIGIHVKLEKNRPYCK